MRTPAVTLLLVLMTAPVVRAQNAPAPAGPPAPSAPAGGSEFATAEDLLGALESADADLRSLSCQLLWTKTFDLGEDRHTRNGRLYYVDSRKEAPSGGTRKFAIHIDETIIGERKETKKEQYVFDGARLVERHPDDKRLVVYELKSEGQAYDPLKIGEGPIPLPIGQKRADILARFDVELLAPEKDLGGADEADTARLVAFVQGAYQLRLTPKADQQASMNFTEIRLWYKRGTRGGGDAHLLPRMARTVDRKKDVDLVQLVGVKTNQKVDETFDATAPKGWEVQVRQQQ